jgi:hypothetical protein
MPKRKDAKFGTSEQTTSQHRAFVKAARELGCDDDSAAFDKVMKKIASAPSPKSVQKRKTKKVRD